MFELIKNYNRPTTIDSLFNDVFKNNYSDYYLLNDEKFYSIELPLPGLNKKDIKLNINDNYLFLSYDSKKDEKNTIWNNSFKKRIKLPRSIQKDTVSAKLKDGILSIKIAKLDYVENSKSIEIK